MGMNNSPKESLMVAVIQLTSTPDLAANLARTKGYLEEARDHGADLVVLPENYGFLGSERSKLKYAQGLEDGPFISPLRELAQKFGMGIIAGGMPERGPDVEHVFNTSVFIGRDGEILGSYRKIHLFDIDLVGKVSYQESASVAAGEDIVVVNFDGWKVGLSICYDLRFPELYRAMIDKGAELITVPAAFTAQTGEAHWAVLLRARAIENQCFVAAAGQYGEHLPGRISYGKSALIDPWGRVLNEAPDGEGVLTSHFRKEVLTQVRTQLPCLTHRRVR